MLVSDLKKKCGVLVVSCDKYSDVWPGFFELINRFWPDCPFNVYLLSNTIRPSISKVINILVGRDISWSDNLKMALEVVEEEYVLLFIEDLYLYRLVSTKKVLNVIEWAISMKANYVRLNPLTKADKPFNDLVGIVSKGTLYRSSTVMSLWKKEILQSLLKAGESAWDFEVYGSIRSDQYDSFFATKQYYFPVINTVIKSKWERIAIYKLHKLKVYPENGGRQIMTIRETAGYLFKRMRTKLFKIVPSGMRRRVKELLQNEGYTYHG